MFQNGDPVNGKELIPDKPYNPVRNKELEYLREFVAKSTSNQDKNRNKNVKSKRNGDKEEQDTDSDGDDGDKEYGYIFHSEDEDEEEEEEEQEQTDFEVKRLHSRKQFYKGDYSMDYYLVEWKGYALDCCTWEPKGNLDCDEILAEFNKKIGENQKMKDCVACGINGFTACYTKPCFKHHTDDLHKHEYGTIVKEYSNAQIRKLTKVKLENDVVLKHFIELHGNESIESNDE